MSRALLDARFAPLTRIVRHRLLPTPGEVLVHVGDVVQPHDVVARAPIKDRLHVLDMARILGVSINSAERYMRVQVGDTVRKDDLLASTRWPRPFRRELRAPFAGTVQALTEGQLFMRRSSKPCSLRAYIPGEVIEEYPHSGVAIRTTGTLVRGIWGSGESQQGILATIVSGPQDVLTWERVSFRYRGTILVGGALEDPRVLLRAVQFRLNGLLVGSIAPSLCPMCERLALPIVVTEGFGRIPMAEPVFSLLRSHHGRRAVISGAGRGTRYGPELIVPLPAGETTSAKDLPALTREAKAGAWVRLTRPPYLGMIGKIMALPPSPQETAIGARAFGAEVQLANNNRRVFVPFVNLEVLGW